MVVCHAVMVVSSSNFSSSVDLKAHGHGLEHGRHLVEADELLGALHDRLVVVAAGRTRA